MVEEEDYEYNSILKHGNKSLNCKIKIDMSIAYYGVKRLLLAGETIYPKYFLF